MDQQNPQPDQGQGPAHGQVHHQEPGGPANGQYQQVPQQGQVHGYHPRVVARKETTATTTTNA
eukprot:10800228-Prorocentrum_lima.AAC.1